MGIKMAALTQKSGVSKSTILYYLKEGLLPPPQKPKPNVHIYHDSSISILQFIKYLQENLHYSITEIKSIIHDNHMYFDDKEENIVNYLIAINGLTKKTEINNIKTRAHAQNIDTSLFETYKELAAKLALLEYEIGIKLMQSKEGEQKEKQQKLFFDILFTLKPYIFNQATIKQHQKRTPLTTKETLS